MKKSLKRKLVLLFCFLYIATDIGSVTSIVNAESKKEVVSFKYEDITINGVEDVELEKGTSFDPLSGVEALDRNGVNINSSLEVVGDVDVNTIGEYEVVYTAKDELGESKIITRKVKVVEKKNDTTNIVQEGASVELEGANTEDKKDSEVVVEKNEEVKADQTTSDEKSLKITGIKNLTVKLGENINLMDGVKAFDEKGSDLTSFIKTEGEVDFNKAGEYKVKYYIEKEGLPKSELERSIVVVDSKNIINIYTEEEKEEERELAFSIFINEKEKKLSLVNKSNKMLSSKRKEESIFKIKIFDAKNNENLNVDLLGKDTLVFDEKENEELKKKIESLEKYTYEEGDLIQIISSDSKKVFDIKGDILGDITKEKEDYSDGVDNEDYIKNVRFKISQGSLEGVYNKEPVFEGLTDIEVSDINAIDYLKGVKVTDDHDGEIKSNKIVISKERLENEVIEVLYKVTDSWGRTSSKSRNVKINSNENISTINSQVNGLGSNRIVVKGVKFATDESDERFKIAFDTRNKRITIPFADGKILSNKEGNYFKFALYNSEGKIKTSVELKGKDRSNSKKLDAIRNFRYEIGDYISLWHYDAPEKILIEGEVLNKGDINFNEGISPEVLNESRFKITNTGLEYVRNEKPTISINGPKILTINRGDKIDLREDIEVSDGLETIAKESVEIEGFDPTVEGTQIVTYKVKDSWELEGTATRTVVVNPKNDLDGIKIDFKDDKGLNIVFTLKFDDIDKSFKVINQSNIRVNSSDRREAIVIKVFNKYGKARKTFRIYGNNTGNSTEVNNLKNFKYSDGEYIEIWTRNIENGVIINGNIQDGKEDDNHSVQNSGNLENVRYKLGNGNFTYIYNEAPVIVGPQDTSILRGQSFEPLNQVVEVTDDNDIGGIDKSSVKVEFDDNLRNEIGVHDVVYKVKDSWGREGRIVTKLTVKPLKGIEGNSIKLLSETEEMINIGFDSINGKLKVLSYNDKAYIEGDQSDDAFVITIYEDDGLSVKKTINFKFEELITDEKIKEINDIELAYNNKIMVKAYKKDKVSFSGEIITTSKDKNYKNGFNSDDDMLNTRFKITELGLDDEYNNAPEIQGLEKARVIINSDFEELHGVTAIDIEDGQLDDEKITVEDVDTSQLGIQNINYTAKDNLNRVTTGIREVEVLPTYTSNIIEFLDNDGETIFSFRVNDIGTGFNIVSSSDKQFDSSSSKEALFKITLYNEKGEVVKSWDMLGEDRGNDQKFNEINNVSILKDYSFSVWAKDTTKIKISGDMIKDREIRESYDDGITNKDYIENVRFTINGNDLKANYNKAPTLDIPDEVFQMYLGEEVDLTKDITINDDRDTLSKENIKVTADLDEVGETTATLVVTDSWGRKSQEYNRSINIKKGLERHELIFSRVIPKSGEPENDKNHFDAIPGLRLKFNVNDEDNKKLVAEQINGGKFYPTINITIFTIEIFNSDGSSKYKSTVQNQPVSDVVTAFNNKSFEYGDYIKLSFTHDSTLAIKGQVVNGQQVYDPYVKNSYDLEKTKFVITEKGLEAQYDDNYKDPDKQNTITFYEAFAGNMAFRLKINPNGNNGDRGIITTEVNPITTLYLDNNNRNNNNIFTLKLVGKDGQVKRKHTATGRQKPSEYANNWSNKEFEYGDYLMFEDLDRHPKNLRISGNIRSGIKGQELEDYSDGIDEKEELLNTRFYLTHEGIVAVRNDGVRFTGVEDTDILVGTDFNEKDGVEAFSDIDGVVTESISVSENVIENTINSYEVTYSFTDSWGKTSSHERIVNVRPKVYNNIIEVYNKKDLNSPLIQIRADNVTGKYEVTSNSNDFIDKDLGIESAFKIWIINNNGDIKAEVNLLGSDTADSNKLDVINETVYGDGDYIKVWRNPSSATNQSLIDTLKIKGDMVGDFKENYSDGINDIDYMNNVMFKVTDDGFDPEYNEPAKFSGVDKKTVLKGESFKPMDGVTVTDDKGIALSEKIKVTSNVNENRIGTYAVTYTVTDIWGRTTSITREVEVVSQLVSNKIEVYGTNDSGSEELKFTLGFDPKAKKFTINSEKDATSSSDIGAGNNNEENIEIGIYDRYGNRIKSIKLSENVNNLPEELLQLNEEPYSNNMFISLSHKNKARIKIKGKIINTDNDYSNGFPSEESMKETRFKITDDGLSETKRNQANFEGLINLTITRGDKTKLFEGVTINGISEEVDYSKIEISNFDIEKAGVQNATYEYIDSWGVKITGEREITVQHRNKLEEIEINVFGRNRKYNNRVLLLQFDDLKGRLNLEIDKNNSTQLPEDKKILEIEIFDNTETSIGRVDITSNDLKTEESRAEIKNRVNELRLEYGGFIHVESYDNENSFNIKGKVTGDSAFAREDYSDGVQNPEYIEHVRFIITEDGLVSVHNEAPTFIGLTEKDVRKGTEFDHFEEVTVEDDKDGEIDKDSIIIDRMLDVDTVGTHTLTYRITDSWGRETVGKRIVHVTSPIEDNIIEFYSSNPKNKAFALKFNSKNNTLNILGGGITNRTTTESDKAIEIVRYNEEGEKIHTYTLTGNPIEDLETLNEINGSEYQYGEYISLYVKDHKEGIKITGEVLKDNELIPEDFSDGFNEKEYMDHVRFKITDLGLEAIYNKAPVLNVPEEKLVVYKNLDINNYNLLEGITFSDDHTELKENDIKVEHDDISNLGEYTIRYELIDSWGRSSGVKERKLEIKNALLRNHIEFETMHDGDYHKRRLAFKLNFMIKDSNGGTLKVSDANDSYFSWHTGEPLANYRLTIEGVNGEEKYNESFFARDKANGSKVMRLNEIRFDYGDKIKVYQSMHKGFKIKGPVPNGIEDYEDGADLGQELQETVFTIQEEGIVAKYTPAYKDTGNIKNSIQWNLGINGNFGFRMSFDLTNRKIIATEKEAQDEYIDTLGSERDKMFRIDLYDSLGEHVDGFDVMARQRPSQVLSAFNDMTIEYGGYISLKSYRKPRNLRVTGNLITNKIQRFEDFEDGIDDVERFNNIRFYFTPDGLYAYENEAPRILGATDLNIIKGEPFNVRDGVWIEDDLDEQNQIELSIDERTFDSTKIGAHQVTYVATDTWGRSSTYDRFIFVTAKPQITLKEENSIYIEKGSIHSEDINDYLKNIVTVTDEEDDDAELTEKLKIEGDFNPDIEDVYPIKYSVTDSDNHTTELNIKIHVVKTISVSVPISVPFQVVTNLEAPELTETDRPHQVITNLANKSNDGDVKTEGDTTEKSATKFISAVLKIQNNRTSPVDISIKSFSRKNAGEEGIEIVDPNSENYWNNLSAEESMKKMALGIYPKKGLTDVKHNENNPVWLRTTGVMEETKLGRLAGREVIPTDQSTGVSTLGEIKEANLSFVAKHGNRFKGGKTKGNFDLVFEFE